MIEAAGDLDDPVDVDGRPRRHVDGLRPAAAAVAAVDPAASGGGVSGFSLQAAGLWAPVTRRVERWQAVNTGTE
jgi:hypothetical protein